MKSINIEETVSKSFSFDPEFWEKIEDLRFKLKYKTMTELVIDSLEEYLIHLDSISEE